MLYRIFKKHFISQPGDLESFDSLNNIVFCTYLYLVRVEFIIQISQPVKRKMYAWLWWELIAQSLTYFIEASYQLAVSPYRMTYLLVGEWKAKIDVGHFQELNQPLFLPLPRIRFRFLNRTATSCPTLLTKQSRWDELIDIKSLISAEDSDSVNADYIQSFVLSWRNLQHSIQPIHKKLQLKVYQSIVWVEFFKDRWIVSSLCKCLSDR